MYALTHTGMPDLFIFYGGLAIYDLIYVTIIWNNIIWSGIINLHELTVVFTLLKVITIIAPIRMPG